jgi:hypothetical protein
LWASADELVQFLNLPNDQLPAQQHQQYKRTCMVTLGCAVHTVVSCNTTLAHRFNNRCKTAAADMPLLHWHGCSSSLLLMANDDALHLMLLFG